MQKKTCRKMRQVFYVETRGLEELDLLGFATQLTLDVLGSLDDTGSQSVSNDGQQDQTHGTGQQGDNGAVALSQSLTEAGVGGAAQNQTQSQRSQGDVEFTQQEADDTHDQAQTNIEGGGTGSISTGNSQGDNDGHQDLTVHLQDLNHGLGNQQSDNQHGQSGVDDDQTDNVHEGRILHGQHGTGLHAMQVQSSQEHSSLGRTGDGQSQHGDHSTCDTGVVSGLGAGQAFEAAAAEQLAVLAAALTDRVGHPGSDIFAGAGDSTDAAADQRRTNQGVHDLLQFLAVGEDAAHGTVDFQRSLILQNGQNLGNAEQTDQSGDQGNTAGQLLNEDEAGAVVDGVHADHGAEEAQEAADPALQRSAVDAQVTADGDAEDGQQEQLPLTEAQSDAGDEGGGQHHDDTGHDGAQGGSHNTAEQSLTALALHGKRITVQSGSSSVGGTGDVQHDSREQTAGNGADVAAQHEADSSVLGHTVGEVDQQSQSHGTGQTGDSADDQTQKDSNGDDQEVHLAKGGIKCLHEQAKLFKNSTH